MPLPTHLLPTTVVGSYPQPDWLLDRQLLSKIVPRTRGGIFEVNSARSTSHSGCG